MVLTAAESEKRICGSYWKLRFQIQYRVRVSYIKLVFYSILIYLKSK